MVKLEDTTNKKELFQEFFTWLFDDSRIINKSVSLIEELDFSLCPNYMDSNIYYPTQFKAFFETKAMQRLNRISQLGLSINDYPNLYHNRLEHSKGTYYRKVEEFLYNFQNSSWRKYIEDNNLKLYIIAELLKIAGHDIGHPPLSHAFEEHIIQKRGIHEEIGKKIMLENPEVLNIYSSISPSLHSIMNELYNSNILNFKQHDESNYDIDRLDYLSRDNLYLGFSPKLTVQSYEIVPVSSNLDGSPKCNKDYSICEDLNGTSYIDVYPFSSLFEIEKLLKLREQRYNDVYFSQNVCAYETCLKNFFDALSETDTNVGQYLKNIISLFKNNKIDNINLDDYLEFDEIRFYSEILEIAEFHEDKNIRDLATMIIPNMKSFLNLIYSHLNLYNKNTNYTNYERDLLKKIKRLILSDSVLANNLKNKNFTKNNILFLPEDFPFEENNHLINFQNSKIKSYKKDFPIYIRDENGNIFELSNHPNRTVDWNSKTTLLHSQFVFLPYLRFKGVPEKVILELQSKCLNPSTPFNQIKTVPNFNLSPLKVEHKIEDVFADFEH